MKKLLSLIGGILTLIAAYHFYLNIVHPEEYSFEQSIKLLKNEFQASPLVFSLLSITFIAFSSLVGYLINKIWSLITEKNLREKNKIQNNLERTKKITDNRNQFFEKVFLKFDSFKDYPTNPMYRIKGDFNEVNIKNINDNNFPLSGYMSKYETFNFQEDGIELLGGENIIGFNLLIDEDDNWDVLDRFDKPKHSRYKKPKLAYSIYFLAYEDILHIDWNKDPIEGNITISCHFKYKKYTNHPFKELRYYIDRGVLGFSQLEPTNRKNFAQFDLLKPLNIYISRIRNNVFRKKIKPQKRLWK